MAKLNSLEFVDYLTRSELVEEFKLNRALEKIRRQRGGELPGNAEIVAVLLIEEGLITRWQADKLFDKKYKGFYLGRYKMLSLLGSGEMSSVYLAEHVLMKQLRAIKVLPKSRMLRNNLSYLHLFHREAQTTASLDHPNLVRAYDVDSGGDQHFIVMEYVEGKTLQKMVDDSGPMPLHVASNFIAQAAEGLDHAHRHGVIHCDIKPANLMVDNRCLVKVLDLGLALDPRARRESLAVAYGDEILATANYLSPEQVADSQNVDLRTDIYNLGCTFYFLLTGHPPFATGSFFQRAVLHMWTMPLNVSQHRLDCPDDLAAICLKMLQKNPDFRYQSMGEVVDSLETWLINHGFTFDPGPSVTARKACALKGSKLRSRIARGRPKKSQTTSSLRFPAFPLPGGGNPIIRFLLTCLVATLLIVATSMFVVWFAGYW